MHDFILEYLIENGPKTALQIAGEIGEPIDLVSEAAADLIVDRTIYLEPADMTLWFAEPVA